MSLAGVALCILQPSIIGLDDLLCQLKYLINLENGSSTPEIHPYTVSCCFGVIASIIASDAGLGHGVKISIPSGGAGLGPSNENEITSR